MNTVIGVDSIPANSASYDVKRYTYLEDFVCNGNVIVDVLIGQDHILILRPLDIRYGSDEKPMVVRNILVWTFNGIVKPQ